MRRPGHTRPRTRAECDAVLARIASRQHGVAGRAQLIAAGFSAKTVDRLVRSGALHALHRGVYAVGHLAIGPLGHALAAVLACGPGAVLCSLSAAVVWELLPYEVGLLHVARAGTQRRAPPGVILHRVTEVEATVRHAIPITTPVRTLLDVAAHAGAATLERAVTEARVRRLVGEAELLRRCDRRPGAAALRALLRDEPRLTRSEAERRLLALLERAGLPRPRTNVRVCGLEVDMVWPTERLIVEIDGFAYHGSRAAFERDRRRDAILQAAGHRVMRFTWRGLTDAPEAIIASVAGGLAAGTASAPSHLARPAGRS